MQPFGYVLARLAASPFTLAVRRGEITASLIVEIPMPVVVIAIDHPTNDDREIFASGRLDLALEHEGTSVFLLWKFSTQDGRAIVVDTPFHGGLEDLDLSPWADDEVLKNLAVGIVVQDETGLIEHFSMVRLPRLIVDHLSPLIGRQLAERQLPDFAQRHWDTRRRFYDRTGSVREAYAAATIKAPVK